MFTFSQDISLKLILAVGAILDFWSARNSRHLMTIHIHLGCNQVCCFRDLGWTWTTKVQVSWKGFIYFPIGSCLKLPLHPLCFSIDKKPSKTSTGPCNELSHKIIIKSAQLFLRRRFLKLQPIRSFFWSMLNFWLAPTT